MIEVHGVDQLAALSRALKEAGRKDLQLELSRGIRQALKPVRDDLKKSALSKLPRGGGLAAKVAGSRSRIVRRADRGLRLSVTNTYGLRRLDSGRFRHPVFADAENQTRKEWTWVYQSTNRGWWSKPIENAGPQARREVEAAMRRVARKIERST